MEENKEKMTPVQVVLAVFVGICFFAVILLGVFTLAGVFDEVNAGILHCVICSLMTLCHLLIACANWKKQKIMSTVQIGIWSFFLGVFVSMLVFALMK